MMRKADWLIPIGLMPLGVVPFVAGVSRIVEIGGDRVITPENARIFDDPVPVLIHMAMSLTFSIPGALQFSPDLRRNRPHCHRMNGRLLGLPDFASGEPVTIERPPSHQRRLLPSTPSSGQKKLPHRGRRGNSLPRLTSARRSPPRPCRCRRTWSPCRISGCAGAGRAPWSRRGSRRWRRAGDPARWRRRAD
jgi:hypothetical protein